MALTSYLSSTEIATLTGYMGRSFETFTLSRSRTITIFKEPKKNISSRSSTSYPGYGPTSNLNNVTSYTAVSGVYPAQIRFLGEQNSEDLNETHTKIPKDAKVRIRVERDCSDFIENGKTEKVIIYDDSYNIIGQREVNSFLGLNYYHYYLERTS